MRTTQVKDGHCPIEVPLVEQMLIDTFDPAMTPADWLKLLGSDPGAGIGNGATISRRKTNQVQAGTSHVFEPSEQVRDLAARLRYTLQQLRLPWSEADSDATLGMLEGIFDSHDPNSIDLPMGERIWRAWVRAELTLFATTAAKDPEVRAHGLSTKLRNFALGWQGRLGLQSLRLVARKQIRLVARGIS
jgi:hypothetical protein